MVVRLHDPASATQDFDVALVDRAGHSASVRAARFGTALEPSVGSTRLHIVLNGLRIPLSEPLFILGVVFILVVFLLPGGIAGARSRFAGLRKRGSDARPCYVTAEEFTTRFVQASRFGKMSAFRRQFRECSALLLDNLNFLATRRATQEEFLHTFDALVADGRQVVVTTDCHPRLADELMPELVDRLLGGRRRGQWQAHPELTPLALPRTVRRDLAAVQADQ